MNTQEFAKNIILKNDIREIEIEVQKYSLYILNLFGKEKIKDITPSKEKEEEIFKSIVSFFPYLQNKDIEGIYTYKNFNYLSYLGFAWNSNTILFNEDIIIRKTNNYRGLYDYDFFPVKKEIHIKYYKNEEENPHFKMDEIIKLNKYSHYKKINYLIYFLQKIMDHNDPRLIDVEFYKNILLKVFALVLLNETEPMNLLKDEILLLQGQAKLDKRNTPEIQKYLNAIIEN